MNRRILLLALVALLISFPAAAATGERARFRSLSEAGGAPSGRYRVTLSLYPGDDVRAISSQLAATYRGQLEPHADGAYSGFVIVMTEASARLLSSDRHVILVEELPSQPQPPARHSDIPSPSAPGRHAAPPPRRPVVNETESTWSVGPYAYDGSGNIKSIDRDDGTKDTFVYDAFGRLTSGTAGAGKQQTYTYDAFGNILTITTDGDSSSQIKLGVDPSTNRISRPSHPTTGEHYNAYGTYDANGNMTANVLGDSFVYDDLGMLKEATVGGARKVYLYTPDDERIAAVNVVNNAPRDAAWTLRDPGGSVLRRYYESSSGSWSWNEDYVYANGQLLAAEVNTPEKTLHFFRDHLGSPRLITGNGGAEYVRRTYYPFGREATPAAYHDYETTGFTGHERDAATLTYMHARSYLPAWGRFLSPDPVLGDPGVPQSWNRYAYVENTPVNAVDPTGALTTFFGSTDVAAAGYVFDTVWDVFKAGLSELNSWTSANRDRSIRNPQLQWANARRFGMGRAPFASWEDCEMSGDCMDPQHAIFGVGGVSRAGRAIAGRTLFRGALQAYNSELTLVGRAVTKHPEVLGLTKSTLRTVLRTEASINKAAASALKNIIRNGVTTRPILPRYGSVVQIQIPGGFGARWYADGRFIGFINP